MNINEFPPEIILQIFDYLTLNELKIARLACQSWYIASRTILPQKCRITVNIDHTLNLCGNCKNWMNLLRDDNCLPSLSLCISNIDINQIPNDVFKNFWLEFGPDLHHLTITSTKMSVSKLLEILTTTKNIKTLKLENIKKTKSQKGEQPLNLDQFSMGNLVVFDYRDCGLKDEILEILSKCMPNIVDLHVLDLSRTGDAEKWPIIFNCVKNLTKTLDSIEITSQNAVETFTDLNTLNDLKLKNLILVNFDFRQCHIIQGKFFRKQATYMESLRIFASVFPESSIFLPILGELYNLKSLVIETSDFIEAGEIECISKMLNLNNLVIEDSSHFNIVNALVNGRVSNLKSYKIHDQNNFKRLLPNIDNFKNLIHLEVFNVKVTNEEIQTISQNVCNLKNLKVTNCRDLTDSALVDPNPLKCISNLKKLQCLELYWCPTITDVGIFEISKLKMLTKLSVTESIMTESGVECLRLGCVYLEDINFYNCHHIDEKSIRKIFNMLNFKKLSFNPKISNTFTDSMKQFCETKCKIVSSGFVRKEKYLI